MRLPLTLFFTGLFVASPTLLAGTECLHLLERASEAGSYTVPRFKDRQAMYAWVKARAQREPKELQMEDVLDMTRVLSVKEMDALRIYRSEGAYAINAALRKSIQPSSRLKKVMTSLDKIIENSRPIPRATLYRGLHFDLSKPNALEAAFMRQLENPGSIVQFNEFLSTSMTIQDSFLGFSMDDRARYLFLIHLPKDGYKGFSVFNYMKQDHKLVAHPSHPYESAEYWWPIHLRNEAEVILKRNTKAKVVSNYSVEQIGNDAGAPTVHRLNIVELEVFE